jgi:hypothetical protein
MASKASTDGAAKTFNGNYHWYLQKNEICIGIFKKNKWKFLVFAEKNNLECAKKSK